MPAVPDHVGADELMAMLREAARAGDGVRAGYARDLLARRLAEDPVVAAQVAAELGAESDPAVLDALAAALAAGPGAAAPAVTAALRAMAGPGEPAARRLAALSVLAALEAPDAETTAAVLGIARADADPQIQAAAVNVAGAWMGRNPSAIGGLSPELARIAQSAADGVVRGYAIQAMALLDRPLPSSVMDAMGEAVRRDPSPMNRGLAAMALGGASLEQRGAALQYLEQAYLAEASPEVRRGMLIHVVRAGRLDARPVLDRIAAADPAARQDVRDYAEILGSGVTDPDRVWEAKFARDAARGTIPGGEEGHHD